MAAQQPGGLPDHQTRALSAAYTGVCAAKEPVRTPGDLARLKGVGGWVVDVMEDSFPGSSLDLSPPRSNTPGETGNSFHDCSRDTPNLISMTKLQKGKEMTRKTVTVAQILLIMVKVVLLMVVKPVICYQ
ncbi:crossover junction endonuclease MUS81-like isoform X2 [Triticum urartu]|uniref:Crossover junction endonuclease MUS81 n=1 Tax=Triticum urartu TaxID=4572 RepID=A0A8R7RAL8_TRIUA|nr:crossover junction endonuclease MUS81-like isoform X2 [Triticum urartu]